MHLDGIEKLHLDWNNKLHFDRIHCWFPMILYCRCFSLSLLYLPVLVWSAIVLPGTGYRSVFLPQPPLCLETQPPLQRFVLLIFLHLIFALWCYYYFVLRNYPVSTKISLIVIQFIHSWEFLWLISVSLRQWQSKHSFKRSVGPYLWFMKVKCCSIGWRSSVLYSPLHLRAHDLLITMKLQFFK